MKGESYEMLVMNYGLKEQSNESIKSLKVTL